MMSCSVAVQHALLCPDAVNIIGFLTSALDASERTFARFANCTLLGKKFVINNIEISVNTTIIM